MYLYVGVGVPQLQKLVVHYSKLSGSSRGVRYVIVPLETKQLRDVSTTVTVVYTSAVSAIIVHTGDRP